MKNERTAQWAQDLRSTDKPQVQGRLVALTEGGTLGYCCLGFGSVYSAGLDAVEVENGIEPVWEILGCDMLPPAEFHTWLGRENKFDGELESADVLPDWGEVGELPVQGRPGITSEDGFINGTLKEISYAGLNDTLGLTFDQIADMIDYFGVAE